MYEETQNILIVDDEKSNLDILLGVFESINKDDKYNIIATRNGKKALEIVKKRKIDLILLDIMMPDLDGYEICTILKSNEKTKHIPILFITANTDDDSITKAYSLGAADYVMKPFRSVELIARVELNLKFQRSMNQLKYYAYYDPLTGIYNRRKFFNLAEEKFQNEKEKLFAVMIDIDNFKSINDKYGHGTGDIVIKMVATTIKESLEEKDMFFGRLGGEEFAIISAQHSQNEMERVVEIIRQEIESISIEVGSDTSIKVTISSGIAQYDFTMPSIDHLLNRADEALYEAKNTGRNRTVFRL